MPQAPTLPDEHPQGYVCSRCNYYEIHRSRLLAARTVEDGSLELTHRCPCSPGDTVRGRYHMSANLMYRLFRERIVQLPWQQPVPRHRVSRNHPAMAAFRTELAKVHVLEDIPGMGDHSAG